MSYRENILLVSALFFVQSPLVAEEAPSMELLEFLGQWETGDGQWLGPQDIEEMDFLQTSEDLDEVSDNVDHKPVIGEVK